MSGNINILFVCSHNSARSQMAEALFNMEEVPGYVAESAGLEAGILNPYVVLVLRERGVDITGKTTRRAFDLVRQGRLFRYVITVCDERTAERCPIFPGFTNRLHWSFEDPSTFVGTEDAILEKTRQVRDQIHERVRDFIQNLEVPARR